MEKEARAIFVIDGGSLLLTLSAMRNVKTTSLDQCLESEMISTWLGLFYYDNSPEWVEYICQ